MRTEPPKGTSSSEPIASVIDRICDDFEAAWRDGKQPRVDEFLGSATEPLRTKLLTELLLSDLECRSEAGLPISLADYVADFPDRQELIATIISQFLADQPRRAPQQETFALFKSHHQAGPRDASQTECGNYQLIKEIARGGMGIVFQAYDKKLRRTVALKMILDRNLASPEAVRRFHAEAEAAAGLNHSGIVPVYDVGSHQGHHYYAMGFVDGPTLASELQSRSFSQPDAAKIIIALARAVAHAHEHGIVHRDLKPDNVLLTNDGDPLVTDFGLAKRTNQPSDLTVAGQILGTPGYMAPEQAAGKVAHTGPAVDIYALGAILYHLLTGRPPFRTGLDAMLCVLEQDPVPPRALNRHISRDLNVICMKCLSKEPRHRYGSAKQLADDLQRYLDAELIHARPASLPRRLHRWARHRPRLAAVWLTMLAYYAYHLSLVLLGRTTSMGTFHWLATAAVAIVCLYAWMYQAVLLRTQAKTAVRFLWSATDVVTFTLFLMLAANGVQSPLAVIYLCLVAAAALSFDRYLVWLITGTALLSYAMVVVTHPWLHPDLPSPELSETIPMVISMAAIGLIQYFVLRCLRAQQMPLPAG